MTSEEVALTLRATIGRGDRVRTHSYVAWPQTAAE